LECPVHRLERVYIHGMEMASSAPKWLWIGYFLQTISFFYWFFDPFTQRYKGWYDKGPCFFFNKHDHG
jgi:hypothetical protein